MYNRPIKQTKTLNKRKHQMNIQNILHDVLLRNPAISVEGLTRIAANKIDGNETHADRYYEICLDIKRRYK